MEQLLGSRPQSSEDQKVAEEISFDHPHYLILEGTEHTIEGIKFLVHFSKNFFQSANSVGSELHFSYPPHICKILFEPAIEIEDHKEFFSDAHILCKCCGKDHGSVIEWARRLVSECVYERNPQIVQEFKDTLRDSPEGQAWLNVSNEVDPRRFIRFSGSDYTVSRIKVVVHAISAKAPLECSQYEMHTMEGEESLVSHFHGTAAGREFDMVIPHVDGGVSEKIVVNISTVKQSPKKTS